MPKGLFIVFEGIDGAGKSTQCRLLLERLIAEGHTVHFDREPSDGIYGRQVRESATTGRLSPEQELELFHKDRKQHVDELILPAKARGEVVILDRYYFSTMAYQGQRGFDPQSLREQNEAFAPQPDLLFILDLPVEVSIQRIGARGEERTEFEKRESLEFCRKIYLGLSNEPFTHIIDCTQDIESIQQEIAQIALEALTTRK